MLGGGALQILPVGQDDKGRVDADRYGRSCIECCQQQGTRADFLESLSPRRREGQVDPTLRFFGVSMAGGKSRHRKRRQRQRLKVSSRDFVLGGGALQILPVGQDDKGRVDADRYVGYLDGRSCMSPASNRARGLIFSPICEFSRRFCVGGRGRSNRLCDFSGLGA